MKNYVLDLYITALVIFVNKKNIKNSLNVSKKNYGAITQTKGIRLFNKTAES